jgi:hypothetical protein
MTNQIFKNKLNIHICVFCYNYIESKKVKKQFTSTNICKNDDKCKICDRYIDGIINGPNIIDFINNNKLENDFFIKMNKYKSWYFNDIYDNFGYYLKNKFKYSHEELKNIYQSIDDLQALPNITIINTKAKDLI